MPRPSSFVRLLALLTLVISLGFGTLVYEGPGSDWAEGYGGAICYEIFWVLALKAALPQASIGRLAATVFLATSALEFLQLSRHPWLEWIRSFYLGRVFFGAVFDPWDFLYYALGAALALWLHRAVVEADLPRPLRSDPVPVGRPIQSAPF